MDKKRLKEEYKKKKPDMGIYKVNFNESDKVYLGIAEDLKGNINSLKFQLKLGSFRQSNNLQNEYNKFGDSSLNIEVVEVLEYKDNKENYIEELEELRELVIENYKYAEKIKYRKKK